MLKSALARAMTETVWSYGVAGSEESPISVSGVS